MIKADDVDALSANLASLSTFLPSYSQTTSNKDKMVSIVSPRSQTTSFSFSDIFFVIQCTQPQYGGSQLMVSVTLNNTTALPLRSAEISFSKNADLELIPVSVFAINELTRYFIHCSNF